MTEDQTIKMLTEEGYANVYAWNAVPRENDPHHNHPYDTALIVLEGEISIKIGNEVKKLEPGDRLDIGKLEFHSAVAGAEGCKYVVANKKKAV